MHTTTGCSYVCQIRSVFWVGGGGEPLVVAGGEFLVVVVERRPRSSCERRFGWVFRAVAAVYEGGVVFLA